MQFYLFSWNVIYLFQINKKHQHIITFVRPYGEEGKFMYKTIKLQNMKHVYQV